MQNRHSIPGNNKHCENRKRTHSTQRRPARTCDLAVCCVLNGLRVLVFILQHCTVRASASCAPESIIERRVIWYCSHLNQEVVKKWYGKNSELYAFTSRCVYIYYMNTRRRIILGAFVRAATLHNTSWSGESFALRCS